MSTITVIPFPTTTARPARRPVTAERAPRQQVRLTRRGRLTVLVLALVVLAIGVVSLGPSVVASGERGDVPATAVVTVQPGQTLWQIAAEANPGGDPRATVDDIMRMNSLSSAGALQMGSELAVPVYE